MRLLLLLYFLCFSSMTLANEVAVVVRASGEVLRINSDENGGPLKRKDTLIEGDFIQTGAEAYATLKFSDQSVLDLAENTQLKITQFRTNSNNEDRIILLELLSGRLRTITGNLAKEPDAFELRTEHASIGVRGTEFEVIIVSREETQVIRYSGNVLIRSLSHPETLIELDGTKTIASVIAGNPARYLDEAATTLKGLGAMQLDLLEQVEAISAPVFITGVPLVLPLSADGAVPVSEDTTPKEPMDAFVSAVNQQQWQLAQTLANELQPRFEGLPRFDLYYGLLLVHEQSFDEAIFAFERVLIFHPDQHRARLELGRCYYLLKNHVRAQDALGQVLAANPPKPIEQAVRTLIARNEADMRRTKSKTLFGGEVQFGWDSNANLGSDIDDGDLDPNLLGLTDLADTSKPIESGFIQWSIKTGLIQPTSQYSSNYFQLDFNSKNYFEDNAADISSLTGMARYQTQYDRFRYLLPLSTELSWREGKLWQSSSSLGVTPQFLLWGPLWAGVNLTTEIDLSLDDDNTTAVKDSAGIVLNVRERGRTHSFSSHYVNSTIAGQDDEHLEWQGLANAYTLNWTFPFNASALLSVEHEWHRFKGDDLFFTVNDSTTELKRRQDHVLDALFNTSWVAADWLKTSLIFEWHQTASNINAYSHKQWVVSSAINLRF